jgi:hypothetical protein
MAVTVTNSTFSALNTITTITSNAATADVDGTAEVFTITPTKAGKNLIIIIGGTGSGADGNISYSIAAGDLWAAGAITGTVTKNTEKALEIDTAKVLQDDGTILLTLDPADTDKLVTNHAAYVKVIEMLA